MVNVVSISLGSSSRDHDTTTELFGHTVRVRRIGVDGDLQRARELFLKMDDEVDAFGMGGCEFGINFDEKYYPLRSIKPLIKGLKTPVVDGSGVRAVVEYKIASFLIEHLSDAIKTKRVLVCVSSARWDLVRGFQDSGFTVKFGDPGFILGLPIGSTNYWLARKAGKIFIPLVVRAPFNWLYPTGKKQLKNEPKFEKWFEWADIIADDFHYIKRHLPDLIQGKVVVTNTTTAEDQEMLRSRGASYLVTSTPILAGRSFGTNVLEAILTGTLGKKTPLSIENIRETLETNDFQPPIVKLN